MTMFFAKKLNKKGFTLAELLIVVAIIAVLIAIAVPIFTNSLEKSRYAVHSSNGRALKSIAVSELLGSDGFASQQLSGKDLWIASGTYDFSSETMTLTAVTNYKGTRKAGMWLSLATTAPGVSDLTKWSGGKDTNDGSKVDKDTYAKFVPDKHGYESIGRVGTGSSVKVTYVIIFSNVDISSATIEFTT